MSTPYDVLMRITTRQAPDDTGPRCEMCADPIGGAHAHVVDVAGRQLMCVCRGCHLLFTDPAAEQRYRAVSDRCLSFPGFGAGRSVWDALQIPVDLVFLFRNSALKKVVAFYPGPAGATESELDLAAWQDISAADHRVELMNDDVEALLIRSRDDGTAECLVIPIDSCYELVGGLRMRWRGFDGGQDVATFIDEFFERLSARAKDIPR